MGTLQIEAARPGVGADRSEVRSPLLPLQLRATRIDGTTPPTREPATFSFDLQFGY